MGVAPDAVIAWEGGDQPIGPVADRLLRLLAARRLPRRDELPDEMYVRWIQSGVVQPILCLHSDHAPRLPWEMEPSATMA